MVRSAKTLVSNGGPSRAGEKRKNPSKHRNRYSRSRQLERIKRSVNRKVANIEHEKNGLYKCLSCWTVKPESLFPQHVATSGKFSRYESCENCLDATKEKLVRSGITQENRDRNATRSIRTQQAIKANLRGKPGYDEYEAECDAANPPKTGKIFKIRCAKEEMVEKFPLVHHGLVDCFHSNCFF